MRFVRFFIIVFILFLSGFYYYIWSNVAESIKVNKKNFLTNNAVIKDYKDIKITGFPIGLDIKLIEPIFNDNIKTDYIIISHNFFRKKINIIFDKKIDVDDLSLQAPEENIISIKYLQYPILVFLKYQYFKLNSNFQEMSYTQPNIEIYKSDKKINILQDFSLKISKDNNIYNILSNMNFQNLEDSLYFLKDYKYSSDVNLNISLKDSKIEKIDILNFTLNMPHDFAIAISGLIKPTDDSTSFWKLGYALKIALDNPDNILKFHTVEKDRHLTKVLILLIAALKEHHLDTRNNRLEFDLVYPHKDFIKIGKLDHKTLLSILISRGK